MDEPLVSVVTPFYNTALYLSECLESVLAQSYQHLEYILVDNCSTDGSCEIAERYARRDSRIRLIRWNELLSQVQNYNSALAEISPASKYCKIVQADDYIFPDCLKLMVQAFEQSEAIGLVSAYDLKGGVVRGSGFPHLFSPVAGKETVRLYLRKGIFPFGSPTTLMYRSSLVRKQRSFYDESRLHEDTEKCMQILEHWDFAFVPQVLSFLRVGNESISSSVRNFYPDALDRYIVVKRYASIFLEQNEAVALTKRVKHEYYRVLSRGMLGLQQRPFWRYHEKGLRTLGEKIEWTYLIVVVAWAVLWMAMNPGDTVRRLVRSFKNVGIASEGGPA